MKLARMFSSLFQDFHRKKGEEPLDNIYIKELADSFKDFKELKSKEVLLGLYQSAMNEVDAYFEYTNESKTDREVVKRILSDLTTNIAEHMDDKRKLGWVTLEEFKKDPTFFCEIEYKGNIKECVYINHTFYSMFTSVIFMTECVGKVRKGII